MRAIACFGGDTIHIIGKVPANNELKRLSGGHSELVKVVAHKRPSDFVMWAKVNNIFLICAEIVEGAVSIHESAIPFDRHVIFIVGNEMDGVPVELSLAADLCVYIPMPGNGFCLNTSQTANVLLYEYARRRALTVGNDTASMEP